MTNVETFRILNIVLFILTLVSFATASTGYSPHPRLNLIAFGLLCWFLYTHV